MEDHSFIILLTIATLGRLPDDPSGADPSGLRQEDLRPSMYNISPFLVLIPLTAQTELADNLPSDGRTRIGRCLRALIYARNVLVWF